MLQGFGQTGVTGETIVDLDEGVTSGRTRFWPHVVDKIGESPLIGYGRLAMRRTGLSEYLLKEYGPSDAVHHPHNMYLETLLDNGIIGSVPIWLLWAAMIVFSLTLFRSSNHLSSAVGGLSLSLILTSLIAGLTGQHYYPQEHTLGIWAAWFLSLRVYVEEKRVVGIKPLEPSLCHEQKNHVNTLLKLAH
jgi:O-antigen ligase